MRLTKLLLGALIGLIGAASGTAIVTEWQVLRLLNDQQAEERAYFEALGHAVGVVHNEQNVAWSVANSHLRNPTSPPPPCVQHRGARVGARSQAHLRRHRHQFDGQLRRA